MKKARRARKAYRTRVKVFWLGGKIRNRTKTFPGGGTFLGMEKTKKGGGPAVGGWEKEKRGNLEGSFAEDGGTVVPHQTKKKR